MITWVSLPNAASSNSIAEEGGKSQYKIRTEAIVADAQKYKTLISLPKHRKLQKFVKTIISLKLKPRKNYAKETIFCLTRNSKYGLFETKKQKMLTKPVAFCFPVFGLGEGGGGCSAIAAPLTPQAQNEKRMVFVKHSRFFLLIKEAGAATDQNDKDANK